MSSMMSASGQFEEVGQYPRANLVRAFGMKLGSPEISAPDDGRQSRAVVRASERYVRNRCSEAMYKIHIVVGCDSLEQRIVANQLELIPAHVRHRFSILWL